MFYLYFHKHSISTSTYKIKLTKRKVTNTMIFFLIGRVGINEIKCHNFEEQFKTLKLIGIFPVIDSEKVCC